MSTAGSPHRAWIDVDHDAIRANLGVIRRLAGGSQVIGVVKADAYGHGAVAVSRSVNSLPDTIVVLSVEK